MKVFYNSTIWLIYCCGIGILQILIAYIFTWLQGNTNFNLSIFFTDGFFLFFSISLIASIFYEFTFENDCQINKVIKNMLLTFCVIIGVGAMMIYAMAYASKFNLVHSNLGNYVLAQKVLTGFSIIVSLVMKAIIYSSR